MKNRCLRDPAADVRFSFTGNTFTYDQRGRVLTAATSAGTTTYIYVALGQLIEKSGNGGATLAITLTCFSGKADLRAPTLMTGALSALIRAGLLVVVAIGHPFAGPVGVKPEMLACVLADFAAGRIGATATNRASAVTTRGWCACIAH